MLLGCAGCASSSQPPAAPVRSPAESFAASSENSRDQLAAASVRLASHAQDPSVDDPSPLTGQEPPSESLPASDQVPPSTLADLEVQAAQNNPVLRRMRQEAAAQWAKSRYVSKLPDPSIGGMVYTPPMHYEPDRQLAELQLMQMIPWLGRLRAEEQQAHLEALAADNLYRAERLRVIGELRSAWFKLYVLAKQIETTQADQAQLKTLITTANARIATGNAEPGDVLLATLELSALEEQLIGYRQQIVATTAELNRLAGRDSQTPIAPPTWIEPRLPDWDYEMLRQLALASQPELNAARLRTAASCWGVEVARLKRRSDFTLGAGWMIMDAPGSTMPEAGRDSFTLGVTATAPVWHRKYDAISAEASHQHAAAHASEDEVAQRIEALLADLWEQARASQQTLELYEQSILPQARQTFEADQQSLVNNAVAFDRVVRDYRTLLSLELGYHRALGQLATTLARIQQTVGVDMR
ncbi:MAG: TolC family protein [Planctomycetaceae bacterium]